MMTEPGSSGRRVRFILGLLISILSVGVLISVSDWDTIQESLSRLPIWLFFPVILLLVISLFTRAFAWRTILLDRVSRWKSFLIINAGYFINTIFPFRAGEIGRAVLLLPSGVPFWEGIPAVLTERLFDLLFASGLFLLGLPYALSFTSGRWYAVSILVLVIGSLVVIFLAIQYQERILRLVRPDGNRLHRLRSWIYDRMDDFFSGLEMFSDLRLVLKAFLWMAISWILALVLQYLLLRGFAPQAPLVWAVFALGAVSLGVAVPSSPGNIGIYEASMTLALSALGMEISQALAFAVTSHAVSLLVTTLFGAYALGKEGYALKEIQRLTRKHKKEGI